MIKVSNEVTIYEEDGRDSPMIDGPVLRVRSHWNDAGRVVLDLNGKTWTVYASDLRAAVDNATNTRRH